MLLNSPSAYVGGLFSFSERFTFFKVETLWFSAFAAARQGYPFRPLPLMQRVAGAKAIPDAGGRTERRSRRGHHPGHRPGKVRADAPCGTRRTGGGPTQETNFAFPHKGEYGGAGGVEGSSPLTPCPAPGRRPAARSGQQPRCTERHRLTTTRSFQT